ncbi:hypothetical protein B4U80_13513 [Leptotrombidium deliense]|uniref:BTB domain-containing protein n=1 Tax=Leptotrombidium deliense TaxID=299467 RepID=A0A443S5A2_9ACAR|nr:hypothetical protein B4U80_13513 [Leptotrombidium deliense]
MIEFETQTIDDSQEAFNDISASQYDKELHDIQFICEETVFTGNKLIFQAMSTHWKCCFSKKKDVALIEVTDVKSENFAQILEYMYTGKMKIVTLEQAVQFAPLTQQYELKILHSGILQLIQSSLNVENIWHLFQSLKLTGNIDVEDICYRFIDDHCDEIVNRTETVELSREIFEKIITRNTFDAKEDLIFEMTCKWIEKHREHKDVIKHIHFGNIAAEDIDRILDNYKCVTKADIEPFICRRRPPKDSPFLNLKGEPDDLNITAKEVKVDFAKIEGGLVDSIELDYNEEHNCFQVPNDINIIECRPQLTYAIVTVEIELRMINCIQLSLTNLEDNDQEFFYAVYVSWDSLREEVSAVLGMITY